jgi:hypothetical protein
MIELIEFPDGISWELKYNSGADFFGSTFHIENATELYSYQNRRCVDIKFNTSNITSMGKMFYNDPYLVKVSHLDTSNATVLDSIFSNCSRLLYVPHINTSKATRMYSMFYNCGYLTKIPQLDTSNVTDIGNLFTSCTRLTSIPLLDCGKVTSAGALFGYSDIKSLTDLGGFKNLKINCTGSFNRLPNLTIQSLMNVINNLYDFRANGESTTRTLQLGTTNLNKLTDEQKAVATNKGWNLT